MGHQPFSIRARLRSFRYAAAGVRDLLRREHNARVHLVVLCLVLGVGYWLGLSALEWTVVLLAAGFVFAAEAFNSAIERLADRITPEHDPLIGQAKDLAAAAVLLAAVTAVLVGLLLFVPKIYGLFI